MFDVTFFSTVKQENKLISSKFFTHCASNTILLEKIFFVFVLFYWCSSVKFYFYFLFFVFKFFNDDYLCDTSYTHAFISDISIVTFSTPGALALSATIIFVSCPFVGLLRLERVDAADTLLLPRDPRRDPIYTMAK